MSFTDLFYDEVEVDTDESNKTGESSSDESGATIPDTATLVGGSETNGSSGESGDDSYTPPTEQNTRSVEQIIADSDIDVSDITVSDTEKLTRLKEEVEKEFWPYAFTPDGNSIHIGENEVAIADATDYTGNKETYAGQWVREMIESHEYRDEGNTWLGYTRDNVKGVQEAGIEFESLFRHMAFYGVTGYGKTTVINNMMVQWAQMGYGFCFIDPKESDIVDLVDMLPEERLDDIIWVEPGAEAEKIVGFNFFDTHHEYGTPKHENEVSGITDNFVSLLRSSTTGWGATIESVAESVSRQLIRHPNNYTIGDMYWILSDDEEREKFIDRFGDDIESIYLERLKEYDEEEFDPLLKRFRTWIDDRNSRAIISHKDSKIDITQAVEDGKIILVKLSNVPSEDIQSLITTAIVRRVWSNIKTRAQIPESEREPYFLVMDEFNKLSKGDMNIKTIMQKARSFNLSLTVATQSPSQVPEDIREEMMTNIDNTCTFKPGSAPTAVQPLAKEYDVHMSELQAMNKYELLAKLTVDGKTTDGMIINTFPPYPPRRTRDETEKVIQNSLNKFGAKPLSDLKLSELGLKGNEGDSSTNSTGTGERTISVTDDVDVPLRHALESIYAAGIRSDEEPDDRKKGLVSTDQIVHELKRYVSDIESGVRGDNLLEQISDKYIEEIAVGDSVYYRLTQEGEDTALVNNTGSAQTGGKSGHRRLLSRGYKAFTELGYKVELPQQDGGEQPDGIAKPPINPVEQASNLAEVEEYTNKLQSEYPRLYELFGDTELSIEAESTTITKPKQTIRNLSKALYESRKCVFLVKDGTVEHDDFYHHAKKLYQVLEDPAFVNKKDEKTGVRQFYNKSKGKALELKDGSYALRKHSETDAGRTSQTVWREESRNIILEDPNGDAPLAFFDTAEDLKNPSPTKFPYHYSYSQENSEYIVLDKKNNTVGTYDTKDELKQDYDIIPSPVIPAHEFPNEEYPSPDDWITVVIPDDTKTLGPQLVHSFNTDANNNYTPVTEPLLSGDDLYDPNTHTTDLDKEAENEQNAENNPPEIDSPTISSNSDTQPGTEWEKPDPDDPEYNHAKDNSNYRTGYKEEYVGEDFTGGDARDQDEHNQMSDYEIPDFANPDTKSESSTQNNNTTQESNDTETSTTNNADETTEQQSDNTESSNVVDKFKTGAFSKERNKQQSDSTS